MSAPAATFVCPWPCMVSDPPKPSAHHHSFAQALLNNVVDVSMKEPVSTRSFAQALLNKVDVALSDLPKPRLKGNTLSIKISEDLYQSRLANCNNYLHGRLVLSKGDQPMSSKDLHAKLVQLWKPLDRWKMIPLGRGFFEFRSSCANDLRSVWSNGAWNLKPGLLRLSRWSPDFNASNQTQTHSQVWVRFHYLPLEYWQDKILFEIAGAIGTPIVIDENTRNNSFGHYARVLVDINFAGFIPDTLCVERDNFAFDIEIEYEHPPYFCFTCNSIGHSSDHCKKDPAVKIAREKVTTKDNSVKNVPKRYVQVQGCSTVADEDPIVLGIMRSKEVTTNMLVRDIINLEEELYSTTSDGAAQVQPPHVEVRTEKQSEDQQSSKLPDMCIAGLGSDAVTDLDCHQDDVLNPHIAHDLEILRPFLKGNDASASVPRVYTDEEEREAAINYLKNRSVAEEEPFIEVSNTKKKNVQKRYQVHITRARGRHSH